MNILNMNMHGTWEHHGAPFFDKFVENPSVRSSLRLSLEWKRNPGTLRLKSSVVIPRETGSVVCKCL